MKHYRTLLITATLLSGGLLAGCTAGPPSRLTFHVRQVSRLVMPIAPNAADKETDMVLQVDLGDVDEEGNTSVQVTIKSIKASMDSLGIRCTYHMEEIEKSLKSARLKKHQANYLKVFDGLEGAGFQVKVDPLGNIVEWVAMDERLEPISAGTQRGQIGKDQVAMVLGKTNLAEYAAMGWGLPGMPARACLQDQWTTGRIIIVPDVKKSVTIEKSYTFDENLEDKGEKIGKVTVQIRDNKDRDADGSGTQKNTGLVVDKVEGQGQVLCSLTRGHMVNSEETVKISISASTGRTVLKRKNPNAIKMYFETTTTIELIDME